jgi:hypothetical protein
MRLPTFCRALSAAAAFAAAVLSTELPAAAAAPLEPPAGPVGRLFSTPAQRAELDVKRNNGTLGKPDTPPAPVEQAPQAPPEPPAPLVLNGIVSRSGGKSTVWVNDEPQNGTPLAGAAGSQAQGRGAPASLSLRTQSGKAVRLKPGQRYDAAEDKVRDAYQ